MPAEHLEHAGCGHHGGATRERERAFAGTQRLRGQMECDQRRGASGVDRRRRPGEVEGVGDPAGHDTADRRGQEVPFKTVGVADEEIPVGLGGAADEHAGAAAL